MDGESVIRCRSSGKEVAMRFVACRREKERKRERKEGRKGKDSLTLRTDHNWNGVCGWSATRPSHVLLEIL